MIELTVFRGTKPNYLNQQDIAQLIERRGKIKSTYIFEYFKSTSTVDEKRGKTSTPTPPK